MDKKNFLFEDKQTDDKHLFAGKEYCFYLD